MQIGFIHKMIPGINICHLRKIQTIQSVCDKFSNIGNTHGLRIAVHEPGILPKMLDDGIDLKPGHSTSIALKMQ